MQRRCTQPAPPCQRHSFVRALRPPLLHDTVPLLWRRRHSAHASSAVTGTAGLQSEQQEQQQPVSHAGAADVEQAQVLDTPAMEPQTPSFEDLGVDRLFLPGLMRAKVHRPVEIQVAAIPAILSMQNVAMQSYTGSGKTLAYLLPAMTLAIQRAEKLYKAGQQDLPVQLLVVAPNQELAMQIVRVGQSLLPDEHRRTVQQCIGGANPKYQQESIVMNKPIIVVGTPGRLSEFIRMGVLRLHRCPLLVLDEADQLLAANFAEDMHHIHQHCGKRLGARPGSSTSTGASTSRSDPSSSDASVESSQRQTVLVSATLSQSVLSRTATWCPEPRFVSQRSAPAPALPQQGPSTSAAPTPMPAWGWGVRGWDGPANNLGPRTSGSAGGVEAGEGLVPTLPPQLKHYFVVVDPRHKADELRRCIHAMGVNKALVFMNYQQRLKDTMFKLAARNMKCAALHGEMSKLARTTLLNDFRRGRTRALVVSDVVSRGLDVDGVDAVFNAELPSSASHYAHRAGRTGRMGAPGAVVSLVSRSETFVVEKLSKKLGLSIMEVHTSHGQLVLGPAPASRRWDDEDDNSEPNNRAQDRGEGSGGAASRDGGCEVAATAADRASGKASGSGSSIQHRGRTGRVADRDSALKGRRDGGTESAERGAQSSAEGRQHRSSRVGGKDSGRQTANQELDEEEEDGEVDVDVAQLNKQVRRARSDAWRRSNAKAASDSRLRDTEKGGDPGGPDGGRAQLPSSVTEELRRELDELRDERAAVQAGQRQRQGGSGGRGQAGGSGA